jgi:hypothetical protein
MGLSLWCTLLVANCSGCIVPVAVPVRLVSVAVYLVSGSVFVFCVRILFVLPGSESVFVAF